MDSGPGFIQGAATLVVVGVGSVALAFVFVALCARDRGGPAQRRSESAHEEERRKQRDYEARYFDELTAAAEAVKGEELSVEQIAGLAGRSIEEETPAGLVRMEYNSNNESFEYYTDARNVQYKVLDAVARSFCLAHDCPQLCVHYKDEFDRAKTVAIEERKAAEALTETASQAARAPASEKSEVFAHFKSYNARINKPVRGRTRIVTEKANRFSFRGSLADRARERETEDTKVVAAEPGLSYSAYKDKNS